MKPAEWKRWILGVASTVLAALIIGLGSTAWGLYNRVVDVEKENVLMRAELRAAEKINEAQEREIERLWDNLTELWKDASEAVKELSEPVPR